jgi:antitoxin PrlF
MSTATVTSKGQITILADVRQALQVKAGDRVEFVLIEPGRFEVVAATRPGTDLRGLVGRPSKAVSIDALNKAMAARGASARCSAWTTRGGSLFDARRRGAICQSQEADRILERRRAWVHSPHRDRTDRVMKALRLLKAGTADFADCMVERRASSAGCGRTMTFDVAAAKTADMTLIP